ncbi:hypothetical protein KUV46_15560 [Thalassovita mediterranea]|nr:hypothetical protein KUV46_15560 [Thalassovita mediterranea]
MRTLGRIEEEVVLAYWHEFKDDQGDPVLVQLGKIELASPTSDGFTELTLSCGETVIVDEKLKDVKVIIRDNTP